MIARRAPLALTTALVCGCASSQPTTPLTGAEVFRQSCSACHSLIGNESAHKQGGDLVGYRLTRAELLQFASEMPVRRPLSQAQLAAVTAYVAAAERRAR